MTKECLIYSCLAAIHSGQLLPHDLGGIPYWRSLLVCLQWTSRGHSDDLRHLLLDRSIRSVALWPITFKHTDSVCRPNILGSRYSDRYWSRVIQRRQVSAHQKPPFERSFPRIRIPRSSLQHRRVIQERLQSDRQKRRKCSSPSSRIVPLYLSSYYYGSMARR